MIDRHNCLVIAKSKPIPSKRGSGQKYKWYTLYDLHSDEVLAVAGPPNLKLYIFNIVETSFETKVRRNWNLTYDKFLVKNLRDAKIVPDRPLSMFNDDNLPPKYTCYKTKGVWRKGHYSIKFKELYRWKDVEFFDGFIKTPDGLTLEEKFFPGNPIFMGYFNVINDSEDPIRGGFEVKGQVQLTMQKKEDGWGVGYRFTSDTVLDLIRYELDDLKRAKRVAEHDIAYRSLVAWAKNRLDREDKLDPKEIEKEAEKLGLTNIDPDDLMEKVAFKPDYKKSFYSFIKGKAKETYATNNGFFFVMKNNFIIWEMPKYGASTYIFNPQDIHLLMQRLKITQRAKIYSDDAVAKELNYVNRRKHPTEHENEAYEENWQQRVLELAELNA